MILHYPENALEKLEEVSFLIRHGLELNDYLKIEEIRSYVSYATEEQPYVNKASKLFPKQAQASEEGGEEADAGAPIGTVQDLMSERHIYQWAGIGFGEQEVYRLQKSLKKLATDRAAKSLRFFGKVYGLHSDYYIVEADVEGGDEGEAEAGEGQADQEPKGTGVNKYSYFVTSNSLSEWKKLPDLSLKDLSVAR